MRSRALLCLLLLTLATAALAADGVTLSVAAALDDGATLGVCASYPVAELPLGLPLYADVGAKSEEGSLDGWLGASTDAVALTERLPLVRELSPALDRVLPSGTYLGVGYMVRAAEPVVYLRTVLRF